MRAIGARRRQVALVYLEDGGAARRARRARRGRARHRCSRTCSPATSARRSGRSTSASASTRPCCWSASLVGCSRRRSPRCRRSAAASRIDLREALESTGSAVGGQDARDRLLRRVRFLPRTVQIGLRDVGRRKRRSLATALIVALAVGNLLAVLGLAAAATETTRPRGATTSRTCAIWTGGSELVRRPGRADDPLDARGRRGPAGAGHRRRARRRGGLRVGRAREPLFRYRLSDGRWFTAAEEQGATGSP